MTDHTGLLFIGDPHVASRPPGFRKDDYPETILQKLQWSLDYARQNRLRPIILGDLFDFPRDNANWLIVRLIEMLDGALAISGNHDCKENTLGENDSLSVLVAAGALQLVDQHRPWVGTINTRPAIIGGASWGQPLPKSFTPSTHLPISGLSSHLSALPLVFWITHHDLRFPGYEESARLDCREIPGIDVVINGHIHRNLREVRSGKTLWLNPGNISRVSRSGGDHVPSILRIDINQQSYELTRIPIPCKPYEDVFHDQLQQSETPADESLFVRELALLESRRTATGAGLREFLNANIHQFTEKVANEIQILAQEVLTNAD